MQVHSLTARSISKEFRDGLRRNLPSQLDRNLHTTANSTLSNGVRNLARVSTDSLVAIKNGDIKVPPANGSEEVEGVKSVSALQDRGLIGPKGSRLKDVTEGYQHDSYVRADGSIPGYTSDESGTQSPSPPLGRRLKLQNSIQFWEQLQHSGKWYTAGSLLQQLICIICKVPKIVNLWGNLNFLPVSASYFVRRRVCIARNYVIVRNVAMLARVQMWGVLAVTLYRSL